jgi:hypothetical protein
LLLNLQVNRDGEKTRPRINISISRKAYDALVRYTKQVNEKDNNIGNKPFTIEEVLYEEIIFLSSAEGRPYSNGIFLRGLSRRCFLILSQIIVYIWLKLYF